MAEQIGQTNKWRDLYRLVILKEETLEEVNSYKLTMLNIYIFISTVLVLLSAIIVSIIFYTPIRKMVPGYGDPNENPAYITLFTKVEDMEKQLEAYEIYTSNFRKMVMGKDSINSIGHTTYQNDVNLFSSASENEAYDDILDRREFPVDSEINDDWMGDEDDSTSTLKFQSAKASIQAMDHLYILPPLSGPISSAFDAKVDHFGVDILAPKNTPVKAIMDGHVVASDWTLEAGNTIGIQHGNNIFSFYKHNAVLLKKAGSFVRAGEAIAIVGNTGKFTTGPHLHFELWQNGLPVDPELYIDFK